MEYTHTDIPRHIQSDTRVQSHTKTHKHIKTKRHTDICNHAHTGKRQTTTQTHVDIPNTHTHTHTTTYKKYNHTDTRYSTTHTLFSLIFDDLKISSEWGGLAEALVDNSYFFLTLEDCALIIQDAGLAVRVQVLEWPQGGRDSAGPASCCTVQAEPLGVGRVLGGSVPGWK